MKSITSAANPSYRGWLRLTRSPRAIRESGCTLAEGTHLVQCALDTYQNAEALLVRRGRHAREAQQLIDACAARGIASFELAATLYDRLAPVEHGIGIALVIDVPQAVAPAASAGDVVYLDGIQDPGNAGALVRVAAAAGIGHVLAAPSTVALWSPKVLRGGQGAHFRVAIIEGVDPATLRQRHPGTWIAANAHEAPSLWSVALPHGPVGWIFGAEGHGVSPAALAACDLRVTIPVDAATESLNVAAAAAVCLFERRRRMLNEVASQDRVRAPESLCGLKSG